MLRDKFYIDELYGATFIAFYAWWARVADWFDRRIWGGAVTGVTWLFGLWAQLNRFLDTNVVDGTLRQRLRRALVQRRPARPRAEWPRANLPQNSGARRHRAGQQS